MNSAFTLDTSGAVMLAPGFIWSDLDPFTQGYIEALLREGSAAVHTEREQQGRERSRFDRDLGFSDLAPETLAAILTDCARRKTQLAPKGSTLFTEAERGRLFWEDRQVALVAAFPSLTPYLGDDGKVYLRAAWQ